MENKKKYNLISNWIIISIFSVLLLIVCLVGATLAWLTDTVNRDGQTVIGKVGVEIYNDETLLSGTYENGSYTAGVPLKVLLGEKGSAVNANLSVKNTGNIPGIVRCLFVITDVEKQVEHSFEYEGILDKTQVDVNHDNWEILYSNELIKGSYYYDIYLNSQLSGGKTVNVMSQITPLVDELVNKNVYVYVRADIVAYSGNAYQMDDLYHNVPDENKPFGNLSDLFLVRWNAWK